MSILQLINVSYTYKNRYQRVRAVKEASFEFEIGKLYAVVGKSGSGKTTMLSMLAGLDLPTEGDVVFEGNSTRKINRDKYRREDVSVIYQNFNLFPLLKVIENVMYPLELRGVKIQEARKIAEGKIDKVGLTSEVYKRYPGMLSGGEQQRIAIARALATDAKVILADEPTGNLDTENGDNIINILSDLAHTNGYCVIIVTHDMSIAARADVVLTMKDGRVFSDAPQQE